MTTPIETDAENPSTAFTLIADRGCGGYSLLKGNSFDRFSQPSIVGKSDFAAVFPMFAFQASGGKIPWIVDVASLPDDPNKATRRAMAGAIVRNREGLCVSHAAPSPNIAQSELQYLPNAFHSDTGNETAPRNRAAIALSACTQPSDCLAIRTAFARRQRPTLVAIASDIVVGNLDTFLDLGQVCTLCFDRRAVRLATGIVSTEPAATTLIRWGLDSFVVIDDESSELFSRVDGHTIALTLPAESQPHCWNFWGRLVDQLARGTNLVDAMTRCGLCSSNATNRLQEISAPKTSLSNPSVADFPSKPVRAVQRNNVEGLTAIFD